MQSRKCDPNKNYGNHLISTLKMVTISVSKLQLGYTLPQTISSKLGLGKARFYVMSQNLFDDAPNTVVMILKLAEVS